jgi:hypothetical protein
MSNFALRKILANLSLICLAVNRIFIILCPARSSRSAASKQCLWMDHSQLRASFNGVCPVSETTGLKEIRGRLLLRHEHLLAT